MNIEQLRSVCMSFNGTTEDIKWENHLCFCVAEKMFLITGLDQVPTSASFKVDPEDFDALVARDGFAQAAYFAKRQWVRVDDIGRIDAGEWAKLARNSYDLVAARLPKRVQRELEAMG